MARVVAPVAAFLAAAFVMLVTVSAHAEDVSVAAIVPATASHALIIDRQRPLLASLAAPASTGDLDTAAPAAPRLTPQLLSAYIARQKKLRAFDHFYVRPKARLTPQLLSSYIERQRNPALAAIDAASDDSDALSTSVLASYAAHDFVPTKKKVKLADGERLCLTQAIYHEARGESVEGQWAVANIIINRAFSRRFPSTIGGVVFQNADKGYHRCQFTFACDGKSDMGTERKAWQRAMRIADAAFAEFQKGDRPGVIPGTALYYHTRSVWPQWSNTFQEVAEIGAHIFYAPNR
jgi:spore germination cell wall hydrolase CwlJ-like protein